MALFKDMAPEELREAYRHWRTLSYNASNQACATAPRSRNGRAVAASWGRALRNVEMIERIADKRGIAL